MFAVPAMRSGLAAVASRTRFEAGAWFLVLQNCSNPLVPHVGTEFSQLPDSFNQLNQQHSNLALRTDGTVSRTQCESLGYNRRTLGQSTGLSASWGAGPQNKWFTVSKTTASSGREAQVQFQVIVNDE